MEVRASPSLCLRICSVQGEGELFSFLFWLLQGWRRGQWGRVARGKQWESLRPAGALQRLLPATRELCLDRHPCAVGRHTEVCLQAPPVGPPPLAAGRRSPDLHRPSPSPRPWGFTLWLWPHAGGLCASPVALLFSETPGWVPTSAMSVEQARHAHRKWLCFASQLCSSQTAFLDPWWFCGRLNSFLVIKWKNKPLFNIVDAPVDTKVQSSAPVKTAGSHLLQDSIPPTPPREWPVDGGWKPEVGAGEGNGLTFCSSLTFPSCC